MPVDGSGVTCARTKSIDALDERNGFRDVEQTQRDRLRRVNSISESYDGL